MSSTLYYEVLSRMNTSGKSWNSVRPIAQPEAQQMPAPIWFGVVLECRPAVHDKAVVHELHVPSLHMEAHRQFGAAADAFQCLDGFHLRGPQGYSCGFVSFQEIEPEITDRQRLGVGKNGRLDHFRLAGQQLGTAVEVVRGIEALEAIRPP